MRKLRAYELDKRCPVHPGHLQGGQYKIDRQSFAGRRVQDPAIRYLGNCALYLTNNVKRPNDKREGLQRERFYPKGLKRRSHHDAARSMFALLQRKRSMPLVAAVTAEIAKGYSMRTMRNSNNPVVHRHQSTTRESCLLP